MTRSQFFKPHPDARETADVTVPLPKGLTAYVTGSDPFDKVTYALDGELMATEYVGDAEARLDEVEAHPDTLLSALASFVQPV